MGRQPLILSSSNADADRRQQLEAAGAEVIQVEGESSSAEGLDWARLLKHIRKAGVQRLMVEGGAAVIDSLMQQPQHIDALLVTVAPVEVGSEGFGFASQLPDRSTSPHRPAGRNLADLNLEKMKLCFGTADDLQRIIVSTLQPTRFAIVEAASLCPRCANWSTLSMRGEKHVRRRCIGAVRLATLYFSMAFDDVLESL